MSDKRWKAFERRVARAFNTVRTPLSGKSSRHTSSDTLHERLYIECKSNVSHPLLDAWQEHSNRARALGLEPVGLITQLGWPGLLVFRNDLTQISRNPLSGNASYWVPHYAKRDSLHGLWRSVLPKAGSEGKTPVLCLGQKRRKGFWVVCRPEDVEQVLCAL